MLEIIKIGAQIGLLYVPLALGLHLALNVFGLPDLTLEGSFGIGAAAMTGVLIDGINPVVCVLVGVGAGALAGLVSALMHIFLRMSILLSGLLMMSASWSIVLIMLETSNVSVLGSSTIFSWGAGAGLDNQWTTIVVGGAIALVLFGSLAWFFSTSYGLSMRAAGMNIQTARGVGIRTEARQIIGLMIANGLAGLSGAIVVQQQGFMDVAVQQGVLIVGLAAMMVGLTIVGSRRLLPCLLAVIGGMLVYRVVVALSLDAGLNPNYLKVITALIVVAVVVIREHARLAVALPGTEAAKRRMRARLEFLEEDRVVKIT